MGVASGQEVVDSGLPGPVHTSGLITQRVSGAPAHSRLSECVCSPWKTQGSGRLLAARPEGGHGGPEQEDSGWDRADTPLLCPR